MNGTKIMLMGIAIILLGIAIATMNFFAFIGGGIGIIITIWGLLKADNNQVK